MKKLSACWGSCHVLLAALRCCVIVLPCNVCASQFLKVSVGSFAGHDSFAFGALSCEEGIEIAV